MKVIRKILIANRGEIAVRIMKTATKMGISTVAIYDEIERDALHVRSAHEAYSLGTGNLDNTYLNINKIISTAQTASCDAIHPGYGFLAENAEFAKACTNAGITFIGPSSESIHLMGNKIEARKIVQNIGEPITSGATGSTKEILEKANSLPYPILIKAAAGGGGKGMKVVYSPNELSEALLSAKREAKSYFGDDQVYVEQFIENPRHIEVQILGDNYGNIIHLYERECSLQRRYQKIIEEAPSPTLTPEVRNKICQTALKIANNISYSNAGTIEFLVDKDLNYYFLEMNTRIQVEHPVTEMVTGIDLVEQQINIASGGKLAFSQNQIALNGHAIECRIYAENTYDNFRPSPSDISFYSEPTETDIRVDSSIDGTTRIHSAFDPMISKFIVWANSREHALTKAADNLENYAIHGIHTNIEFQIGVLKNEYILKNLISTNYIEQNITALNTALLESKTKITNEILISAFLIAALFNDNNKSNVWQSIGYWRDMMHIPISLKGEKFEANDICLNPSSIEFKLLDKEISAKIVAKKKELLIFEINSEVHRAIISNHNNKNACISYKGFTYKIHRNDILFEQEFYQTNSIVDANNQNIIYAPMPGKVVKIDITEGADIQKGDHLLVIEAMKMENLIIAPKNGKIKKLNVKLNDSVMSTNALIEII